MGSEWSEEQAGPEGAVGPAGAAGADGEPGATFLQHQIADAALTRYNGSAEAIVTNVNVSAGLVVSGEVIGAGFWYAVTLDLPVRSTVAGDVALVRVRRGTLVSSPLLAQRRVHLPTANTTFYVRLYGIYAPAADANSVFFECTCERVAGSGTVSVVTDATEPALMGIAQMNVIGQSFA